MNTEAQIFEIKVVAKKKLTNEEMLIVAKDFVARLQGYTTVCPDELKDAKIHISPVYNKLD
jgi:hypothetical protein